jgi:hypothetical protein
MESLWLADLPEPPAYTAAVRPIWLSGRVCKGNARYSAFLQIARKSGWEAYEK